MFDQKALASNITKFRKAKGMSQNDLARALLLSPQSVSKWERGASVPDIENLCLISEFLGVSIDALLGSSAERKRIMIAIDGGGSSTEFLMFTEDGAILERAMVGACNPNSVGIDACIQTLTKGIDPLLSANPSVCGIYVGTAGALLGNNAHEIRSRLKQRYPHVKIKCATDLLNVIASATDDENCVAAICGTGSSVLVKEGEKLTLIGGWGYLLSKGGSGFDLGKDALYEALSHLNGLSEGGILSRSVIDKIGSSIPDVIDRVYKSDISFIASFSPLVFEAARAGDPVAVAIIDKNAKSLAEHIDHAIKSYNTGGKLILSGGVITKSPEFVEALKRNLSSGAELKFAKYPQVIGACLLCAKELGIKKEGLAEILTEQYTGGSKC